MSHDHDAILSALPEDGGPVVADKIAFDGPWTNTSPFWRALIELVLDEKVTVEKAHGVLFVRRKA